MKKMILSSALCAAVIICACGCNGGNSDETTTTTTTASAATEEEILSRTDYLAQIKEEAPKYYELATILETVPHTYEIALMDTSTFEQVYLNTYTIDENYDCVNIYDANGQIDREIWLGKVYYYVADDKEVYTKSTSTDEEYELDIENIMESFESSGYYKDSFKIEAGTAEINGKSYSTDTISDSVDSTTIYYDENDNPVYMTIGSYLYEIVSYSAEANAELFDIPEDYRLVTTEELDEILSED